MVLKPYMVSLTIDYLVTKCELADFIKDFTF